MEFLDKLLTPEVLGMLVGVIVLLLGKSKFFTEQDFKQARDFLDLGMSAGQVAQKTRLKVDEVIKEIETQEQQQPPIPGDTNWKKVQRGARKALRGWLKF